MREEVRKRARVPGSKDTGPKEKPLATYAEGGFSLGKPIKGEKQRKKGVGSVTSPQIRTG